MAGFFVAAGWLAAMWFDFVPGLRAKNRKPAEYIFYGLMMTAAGAVMLLSCLDIYVPNPLKWIDAVITAVFGG